MRLPKLVAAFALLAVAVVVAAPSTAAPKETYNWYDGKITALEVNADGTLKAIAMRVATNGGSNPVLKACNGMRMADHPQLLYALEHGSLSKVKTVDGCVTIATVFS